MLSFIDTNIWVYELDRGDTSDPEHLRKHLTARALIRSLGMAMEIVISAQVMGELFNTITRKGKPPLSKIEAIAVLDGMVGFPVIDTDRTLVQAAARRSHQSQISYYDALIVEAALRAGASILYSEDMQHGMRYGSLELRNPFAL